MSSSPDLDLANQEWLLSGPDVCLVTLTLQQPIVTKNTCFYGSNVVLHFVLLFAVATQLRMNCFDDLFVPTDSGLMSISVAQCTVHVRSSIRQPFGDLVSVCFHTSSPSSILYGIVSDPPPFSSSSMSGWMADMADVVDAAEAGATAPPVTKAAPRQSMMPTSIDDTPTEPATSPRMIDSQVREFPVELQLPTGEIGPREEPERLATRFILNDGRWTTEGHEELLRKAAQGINYRDWNREAREAALRE